MTRLAERSLGIPGTRWEKWGNQHREELKWRTKNTFSLSPESNNVKATMMEKWGRFDSFLQISLCWMSKYHMRPCKNDFALNLAILSPLAFHIYFHKAAFLDAIASPSSWCCQWVSQSVSHNFRFAIFKQLLVSPVSPLSLVNPVNPVSPVCLVSLVALSALSVLSALSAF